MALAEDKIRVIEKGLETDDAFLLHEISSLLTAPALTDYAPAPMSVEAFHAKIEQAETAFQAGQLTDHEEVKKKIAACSN